MSAKSVIYNYLQIERYGGSEEFFPAGVIEDYLRRANGTKGSTTSRRLREMADAGILESRVENGYVHYKLKT